ncbi:MAG TPA: hypothetical protein VHN19_09260 [Burkholderiales bacterium]|nr:hypothetical protein [Burkholderiales bacterium]
MKSALLFGGLWVALAANAQSGLFVSADNQVELNCEAGAMVDAPCTIATAHGQPVPVHFSSTDSARYPRLLGEAREKTLASGQLKFPLNAADAELLRGLDLEKCYPADRIGSAPGRSQGDLLQLCIPANSAATVFLFMRGLCDRCTFEPIALRKQAGTRPNSTRK